MTMDISKNEVEYISEQLESHVVTYHTAARDLNIHATKSKKMLLEYYNSNKEKVTASFVVTGTRLGNTVVQIFQDEADLETQTEDFDEIRTVHVYCLQMSKNKILNSEIALEELKHKVDLSKVAQYYSLGLTKGTELDKVEIVKKSEPKAAVKPELAPKKATDTKKPESKLAYTSRKEKPKQATPISSYVSRKGEKSTVPAKREAPPAKPSYQYKSRKAEQLQPKERVVISSMEEEEQPVEKPAPAVASKSDLNNLFLDDLSDFSDDTKEDAEEPIVVENKTEDQPEKEASPSVAPQVPEDSILRTLATGKSPSPVPERSPTPPQTIDEDGYITTYRAKDKKDPPKSAPAPARDAKVTKPAKKTDGKKKQASLMSFFGKR